MTTSAGRVGLLGGTFDPVHLGHIAAALAARRALALDRVVLIPSHVPPHRPAQPHASAFHRFAMAALAVREHDGMEVSDLELRTEGPSYTIDTLRSFHAAGWQPSQLFFIIGTDAFAEIATWRQYPALLDAAHFVVVSRPGLVHDLVRRRAPEAMARLVDLRGRQGGAMDVPEQPSVLFVDADTPDASSTEIRRRLAGGATIAHLVPAAVTDHIARHHLYRPPTGGSPLA